MSQALVTAAPIPVQIPLRDIGIWALVTGVIVLALLYVVGLDQGATTLISGSTLHEFFHDGRHLLGFPCH